MKTMTCKTIEGNSLTQQLFENYKRTLPKTSNGLGVKWDIETYSQAVKLLYPEVRVAPGQEWRGVRTKLTHICEKHGEYEARADNVLNQEGIHHLGSQCLGCRAEKTKARNAAITTAFVGVTTPDGHFILEHIGYHQKPRDKKKGTIGEAKYRYRCAVCGNEEAVANGYHLKAPGNTTHCGCLSKRDSAIKFSRNKKAADAKCFLYLYSTINTSAMKIGIAKNVKARASASYEQELYVSQSLSRAECWSVEQVMLHRLRKIGLTFDLENVPAWTEMGECGGSEVFAAIDFLVVIKDIRELIDEVQQIGWDKLLDKYIPLEQMHARHLFRYDRDTKRQYQSTGEGYVGQPYRSVFDLN